MAQEKSHHQERYNKVTRVIANPLIQLVFPLITNILDCFRKEEDQHGKQKTSDEYKHIIKRWALVGSFIGTGFGATLCSPGGLTYAMSQIGIINKDFPVNKLSDLFKHQSGFNAPNSSSDAFQNDFKNIFISIMVIAAITIFFKSIFAGIGMRQLKKEAESLSSGLTKEIPHPVLGGIYYGLFGDSYSDVNKLSKWVYKTTICGCDDDQTLASTFSVISQQGEPPLQASLMETSEMDTTNHEEGGTPNDKVLTR